jgi:threonine/homoserine/homoserine lactone efflux protein
MGFITYVPYFLRGLIIGLSIAAPVGPIGVLCIQRTLMEGRARGLVSGLGAALADGLYGAIAGFGLTFISGFLLGHKSLIRLVGGLFLLYLGVRTFLKTTNLSENSPAKNEGNSIDSEPKTTMEEFSNRKGLFSALVSTFFLTVTNPITIIFFTGVFAGLGITDTDRNYTLASALVIGVFLGSALWWVFLALVTSALTARLTSHKLQWINKVSGAIILCFGVIALLSIVG